MHSGAQADKIREIVVEALGTVAPEVDSELLVPDQPLRDQVDLDSMDWLNFLVGLRAALGVDVPESDYPRLVTLDDLVSYLQDKQTR
ncbi:acyl carrier protein [Rhodococcus sp. ABRD24]|uniref:acyl carrier protein n=1 Tax=Rhodococcus sp. ABRD24 TaxID=2507582 RepID=UPI00103B2813|nr:acyl carrier protein [Rhodococcus sp. ABRD24]QBJ96930.1 acyl carrier protein [Rhodococcus sp. ABRD24]